MPKVFGDIKDKFYSCYQKEDRHRDIYCATRSCEVAATLVCLKVMYQATSRSTCMD